MSTSQDIAVIGAGIMGLSAAHSLLCAGHKITIYDPEGLLAAGASAVAAGMLAPYAEIEHMPAPWITASLAGMEFWKKTLPDHITQKGSLLIAHEEDQYILERFRQHLPEEKQGFSQTKDLEPQLTDRFSQGLYLKEEAHLNPHTALIALCKMIMEMGGTFQGELKNPKDLMPDYDRVIDCRGIGAAKDDKDLRGVKGETITVRNPEFQLSRPVRLMHPRYPLYIVPRGGHVFMIGATMIEAADEHVSLRSGLELMSALYSLHPSFGEAEILEIKAGIRPAYPDNLPRISIKDNLIRCNGLFRHGYLLAPVMATYVVDHIANQDNEYMHLFRKGDHETDHQRTGTDLHHAA